MRNDSKAIHAHETKQCFAVTNTSRIETRTGGAEALESAPAARRPSRTCARARVSVPFCRYCVLLVLPVALCCRSRGFDAIYTTVGSRQVSNCASLSLSPPLSLSQSVHLRPRASPLLLLRSSSCAPPARESESRKRSAVRNVTDRKRQQPSERASELGGRGETARAMRAVLCVYEREREREGERASAMECIECPEWKLPLRSFLLVLLYHTVMIYNVNKRTNKRDRCLQTDRGTDRQTEREGERYIFFL